MTMKINRTFRWTSIVKDISNGFPLNHSAQPNNAQGQIKNLFLENLKVMILLQKVK